MSLRYVIPPKKVTIISPGCLKFGDIDRVRTYRLRMPSKTSKE